MVNISKFYHRAQCAFLSLQTQQKYTYKIFINPATGEKIHRYAIMPSGTGSSGYNTNKVALMTGLGAVVGASIYAYNNSQQAEKALVPQ
mmetsp:Transcript_922/g.3184  ORF Transcript_922/g.3184 Transcript_922/m.3184 type:complete len:89 (+) Transcript_922:70-336(+)